MFELEINLGFEPQNVYLRPVAVGTNVIGIVLVIVPVVLVDTYLC